jgi:methylated-DNA-protein-cysteine methyltransferase related protein
MQLPAGFRIVHAGSPRDHAVWDLVRSIPPGRVASYGRLAEWLAMPRSARIVGRAMARSPDDVPAHRVVDARGRLVPGWEREQAQRLRTEGVAVVSGHVRDPIPWWDGPDPGTVSRPARSARSG